MCGKLVNGIFDLIFSDRGLGYLRKGTRSLHVLSPWPPIAAVESFQVLVQGFVKLHVLELVVAESNNSEALGFEIADLRDDFEQLLNLGWLSTLDLVHRGYVIGTLELLYKSLERF